MERSERAYFDVRKEAFSAKPFSILQHDGLTARAKKCPGKPGHFE